MGPLVRYSQTEPLQHQIEVFAPCSGDDRSCDGVFQDEVPTDNPRDQFTHGRVRIGVSTACDGNHGCELRITKPGKRAANSRYYKGEHDGWTCALRDRGGRANEQARTDDSTDAECNEVPRTKRTLETVFPDFLRFCHQLVERFGCE